MPVVGSTSVLAMMRSAATNTSPWKLYFGAFPRTLVSHRTFPFFASSWRKMPLHDPMYTLSPATAGVCASHPPALNCHTISGAAERSAWRAPVPVVSTTSMPRAAGITDRRPSISASFPEEFVQPSGRSGSIVPACIGHQSRFAAAASVNARIPSQSDSLQLSISQTRRAPPTHPTNPDASVRAPHGRSFVPPFNCSRSRWAFRASADVRLVHRSSPAVSRSPQECALIRTPPRCARR